MKDIPKGIRTGCVIVAIVALGMTTQKVMADNNNNSSNPIAQVNDCVMIHDSLVGMKLTLGNQTMLNRHMVHNAEWYKTTLNRLQ
jgi:hypothetical protein